MLEFYTYLFANRSQFERMQRNSKITNIIANTVFFLAFFLWSKKKKSQDFFLLDNLLWGVSCKVSPNPIICFHQNYRVILAFIGLLTFEFLFPNKLKWMLYFPFFSLRQLLFKAWYFEWTNLDYVLIFLRYIATLQSLTGKYRGLQENCCNENRGSLQWKQGFPVMRTGFSLWELTYREFPVSLTGFGFAV